MFSIQHSAPAEAKLLSKEELTFFTSQNLSNFNEMNFDFMQSWAALCCASTEIVALMNQSVPRYFKEKLDDTRVPK